MADDDVLKLIKACDGADYELCEAANFLNAEGASGAEFHRSARAVHRAVQDAYMRVGADSASTGPVTPEAIREVLLRAMQSYRRMLLALNDDLRKLSEKLP